MLDEHAPHQIRTDGRPATLHELEYLLFARSDKVMVQLRDASITQTLVSKADSLHHYREDIQTFHPKES